jgi:Domain of unknown function (DUF222)/HNH endonuclease
VATPELEGQLLELTRYSTAAQLERVLRAYRGVLARELTPEELEHGERYLTCEHDVDGALVIRGRVPADEGALVMAALEAGRDQLRNSAARPDSGGEDTCPPRPSNPDALLLMADTLLASGPADRTGGERYQVVVHVDIDVLSGEANGNEDGRQPGAQSHLCRLEHGEALDPETARRLACDASVFSILERGGQPVSVGRKTRSVPPALRRALASRDQGCRFPGCRQTRFLHAHHIEHWAHGGPTELANLVHLCAHHHRLVHEEGFDVIRGPDQTLTSSRSDGLPIPAAPAPSAGSPEQLQARNGRHGLDITPETTARRWDGSHLDLALTIDTLVWGDARLNHA